MAQLVKRLSHKHEDLSSDLQYSCQKLAVMNLLSHFREAEGTIPGPHWPVILAELKSSGFSERSVLNIKVKSNGGRPLWPPHNAHSCVHMSLCRTHWPHTNNRSEVSTDYINVSAASLPQLSTCCLNSPRVEKTSSNPYSILKLQLFNHWMTEGQS